MAHPLDHPAEEAAHGADATASEVAIRLLRRDIVSGALEPDSKLKLRVLKERYGIGGSPMREALAQLSAQGLVHQLSQKGFRVPPLEPAHLVDITRSRQLVETEAVKLAIEHGQADWEDEIVASFHLLERLYHRLRGAERPDVHEFEARHQRFHRALIAACPLKSVTEFCDQLYVQATRYRLLLRRYAFTREVVVAEHRILMRAVLGRNKAEAARALKAHIGITADVLLTELTGRTSARKPATGRRLRAKLQAEPGEEDEMRRLHLFAGLAAAALTAVAAAAPAMAQTKITVGYTVTADFASGFIAMDQGLFKKRGLDVEYKLVPLNSQLPAAVQSDSITFGGTTVSVFLQAVDGGLDHVAVAGSGVTWKGQDFFGAVIRADLPYAKPDDFIGKKVGAPGLGAFLHVLFRNWLIDNGVDFKKVTFVEVGFPQMADVLKSRNVDAVVTGEPVMGRIQQAGIGRQVTSFTDNLKSDLPIIVYSATRKWVEANPKAARAFYEAIAEGAAIANKDEAAVRASVANFTKMPAEVINSMKLGRWQAEVTEAGIGGWIDIMKRQDMLRSAIDVKKIIAR